MCVYHPFIPSSSPPDHQSAPPFATPHIYVYTRIYIYIYMHIYIYTYIYACISYIHTSLIATGLRVSATLCNATYICIYTYIHISMHIFDIYVCVYITYVYTDTHMYTSLIATGLSFRATVCNETHGRSASSARGDAILLNERSSVRSSAHPPTKSSVS